MQVSAPISSPSPAPIAGSAAGAVSSQATWSETGNSGIGLLQGEPSQSFQQTLNTAAGTDRNIAADNASTPAKETQSGAKTDAASKSHSDDKRSRKPSADGAAVSNAAPLNATAVDAAVPLMNERTVVPPSRSTLLSDSAAGSSSAAAKTLPLGATVASHAAGLAGASNAKATLPQGDMAAWVETLQGAVPSQMLGAQAGDTTGDTATAAKTQPTATDISKGDARSLEGTQAPVARNALAAPAFGATRAGGVASLLALNGLKDIPRSEVSPSAASGTPQESVGSSANTQSAKTVSTPSSMTIAGTFSSAHTAVSHPSTTVNGTVSGNSATTLVATVPTVTSGGGDTGGSAESNAGSNSAASQSAGSGPDTTKQSGVSATANVSPAAYADTAAAQAGQLISLNHAAPGAVPAAPGPAGTPLSGNGLPAPTDSAKGGVPTTAASTDGAALPALNTAQVVQSMGQTEMRVGMHSQEFGAISISTTLSHQELAAQISIDHTGLGDALAAHLPGMQEKLGAAYGVPVRVEIRDTGAQFTGGGASPQADSGTGQRRGNSGYSAPRQSRIGEVAAPIPSNVVSSSTRTATSLSTGRLSIHI
jgi:hypothetical protein